MNIEVRAANVSDLDAICRLLILLFEQEADFEPDYERQVRGVQAILSTSRAGTVSRRHGIRACGGGGEPSVPGIDGAGR